MANYQQVTLSQIQDKLTQRTGPTFWVANEKRDAINEAIAVWQAMTGYWSASFPMIGGNSQWQIVPHQVVSLQRVLLNGSPLTQVNLVEMDYLYPNWENATGTPVYWAPHGLEEFAIAPHQADMALTLEGILDAPVLINPSDYINVGEEELLRLLDYAQHYLAFKEGSQEFAAADSLMKNFLDAAGKRNSRIIATSIYRKYMGLDRVSERRPKTPKDELGVRT